MKSGQCEFCRIAARIVSCRTGTCRHRQQDAYLLGYHAFLGASLTDLGNRHGTIARNNDLMIVLVYQSGDVVSACISVTPIRLPIFGYIDFGKSNKYWEILCSYCLNDCNRTIL